LRSLAIAHCDRDPGELTDGTRLTDAGLTGVDLLRLVAAIEDRFAIDFPADLLTVVATVGDLLHFTEVKASLGRQGGATP
jgi:acyl carrier protein